MLIEEIKEDLPDVKIKIMEPFCLKRTATENTEIEPNKWNLFRAEVEKRAEKYNLTFVELQNVLDKATEMEDNTYWLIE